MCGIFLSIAHEAKSPENGVHYHVHELLDRRGPDSSRVVADKIELPNGNLILNWCCTVLSLRGDHTHPQPVEDPVSKSKLCWNGEAWHIGDESIYGNDTQVVFDSLMRGATRNESSAEEPKDHIVRSLMPILGPFAFVYYDALNRCIYFGRDAWGRRSLLYRHDEHTLTFSSVGDGQSGWQEVPANFVYVADLKKFDLIPKTSKEQTAENITFLNMNPAITCHAYKDHNKYPTFNHSVPLDVVPVLDADSHAVVYLEKLLVDAMDVRTRSIPYYSAHRLNQPRTAVLFSGGLDCTVLARILHNRLPLEEEIDLLNVAFHNPRSHGSTVANADASYELCPDRITARASHAELEEVCPERRWRLVCVNVSYEEMLQHRPQVMQLMSPHDTEMDLSIALALYFASRGSGICSDNDSHTYEYTTPARVLFSGLGADELFGGYQRHSSAFTRQGYAGLLAELELDITRLGQRNLGRDDRVISHWSKEARYPFLDEDLINWAVTAPVWEKCGFGQPVGIDNCTSPEVESGKRVLRLLAKKLGMKHVAQEKKRAIQFGARTAKLGTVTGKIKGTQKVT